MCGIAGILRLHDPKDGPPPHPLEAIPEAWLDILDESIKHRGPDGQGRFRDRATRADGTIVDIAFVHRRLSIIDHEGGHQPMVHDGRRLRPDLTYARGETPRLAHELCPASECPDLVAAVFNGCIYNHRELRKELEAGGHVFETDHSDTEVLVHGWRAWGMSLTADLDGMFAIQAWDRTRGHWGAFRDLVGEKPQYSMVLDQARDPGNIAASASSPVSLLALAQLTRRSDRVWLEPMCVRDWIERGWSDLNETPTYTVNAFYPDDRRECPFEGACSVAICGNSHKMPERDPSAELDHQYLDQLIHAAVKSRLESDVPLGCFLSGGLDSGLIAAHAVRELRELQTFTVRMPFGSYDESPLAAEIARHLNTNHTTLDCEASPAADIVHLIHQLGLPFGDSSLLPTYWVSRAARQHVRVALAGDGGDELFGGYQRHTANHFLNRWRIALSTLPSALLPSRDPQAKLSKLHRLTDAARHGGYDELVRIFPTSFRHRLFAKGDNDPSRFSRTRDPLRDDFSSYLPDDLLRKTDTASMAVGLEVRAPFLARDLVEAALRTPLNVLMPNGQRKGLLKQVARRYLPDHIVDRPKQGFAIPVGEWFRSDYGGMRQLLYDHLESSDPFPGLGEAGVEINMGFVRRMLREHDAAGKKSLNPWHGRDHSQRLYMVLVLSIWAKWLEGVRRSPSGTGVPPV